MKNIFFIFLFITAGFSTSFSQSSISGEIVDSKTGEGVPYTNIGIPSKVKGTVSNEAGKFQLTYSDKNDEVVISSVGYATISINIEMLLKNSTIKLSPTAHDIQQIEVVASKFGKDIILGKKLKERYTSVSFSSNQLGTELGARIKVKKKKVYLKSATLLLNNVRAEGVLFRVNIYDYKNEKIGEKILKENIVVEAPAGKEQKITIDLSTYNIIAENDFLLSVELIKGDGKAVSFNAKKARSGKYTFIKAASNTSFRQLNKLALLAPKLDLGFFVEGTEVLK